MVPLLRAEIAALKGRLHATQKMLITCDSKYALISELFKCAKSRKRQTAALQMQLEILRADTHRVDNNEVDVPILKAMLNEARDEFKTVFHKQ